MQLEHHIANLLKHHNCVIVPEFGGFIANYESAWINRSRAVIYPPYKQILFNGSLTQNDGLLANELVLKSAVSYTAALDRIAAQVKEWRKQLDEGQRIELDEIGFLFLQNNQVIFEQNREVNLLLQAYGLKQVAFINFAAKSNMQAVKAERIPTVTTVTEKTAEKEIVQTPEVVVADTPEKEKETPVIALNTAEEIETLTAESGDPKVIPIYREKKPRNYKYALAAAAVLPIMFYAYWIPMKTDFLNTGKIQMSDFNPFRQQATDVYEKRQPVFNMDLTNDWESWEQLTAALPDHVAVYNLELTDEIYIPVRLKEDTENTGAFNQAGSFHLIAGCFSVESNANNFVKQLTEKGYAAGIVDHKNGLYRVSAGSFAAETEAESALDKFKNEGFSGWILKH
ncbi:MAG: HU-CCDC81 and SPOR domain-containing protein [Bacteroidetes bacterium]|nr:HU-CCDC81 and SPOR domain-containing protein [Bacteroidota bacterium]